jgi:hypothetical protein
MPVYKLLAEMPMSELLDWYAFYAAEQTPQLSDASDPKDILKAFHL